MKETETGNVATMASNGLDYWKIQTVGDGLYELVNLQGDNLVIDGKSSFTLAELNDNNVANKQLSLLYVANTSTLYGYPKLKMRMVHHIIWKFGIILSFLLHWML